MPHWVQTVRLARLENEDAGLLLYYVKNEWKKKHIIG